MKLEPPLAQVYRCVGVFTPPPLLTVSQWADRNRYIAKSASSEHGKFRTDRLPYQREMMDSPCDPDVLETVYLMAKQLGKTESINNVVGFFIDQDPSPILVVYPTLDSAKSWSKTKLMPMVMETPRLIGKVGSVKSRDADQTILQKIFPGGDLTIAGANSPSTLRQKSKRVVIQDEIDSFTANAEGDPIEQADGRAETFHNAVFIKSSTPTIKGLSRIEDAFKQTDQRHFFVPCPKCRTFQHLKWSQVKWDGDNTRDAYYLCESQECGARWTDAQRIAAIKLGRWQATAPFRGRRGFFLPGLYRIIGKKKAFATYLHEFVENFLKAKRKGKHALMVWVNTFLAETFEEESDRVEAKHLESHISGYITPRGVPNEILVVTAGVDVQIDRLEAEAVGWCDGEQSWGLEKKVFPGGPFTPGVWEALDSWLMSRTWKREDGTLLRIVAAGIDTGGTSGAEGWSSIVHAFTKPRFSRRVFAFKGASAPGQPLVRGPSRNNRLRAPFFLIGTDTAKGLIYGRMRIESPGPGYMHFPGAEFGYDSEHFAQLTAEVIVTEFHKGFARRRWHKPQGRRNEALDLRVYATAALTALQPDWGRLKKRLVKPEPMGDTPDDGVRHPEAVKARTEAPKQAAQQPKPAASKRRSRSSWIAGGYRI